MPKCIPFNLNSNIKRLKDIIKGAEEGLVIVAKGIANILKDIYFGREANLIIISLSKLLKTEG